RDDTGVQLVATKELLGNQRVEGVLELPAAREVLGAGASVEVEAAGLVVDDLVPSPREAIDTVDLSLEREAETATQIDGDWVRLAQRLAGAVAPAEGDLEAERLARAIGRFLAEEELHLAEHLARLALVDVGGGRRELGTQLAQLRLRDAPRERRVPLRVG